MLGTRRVLYIHAAVFVLLPTCTCISHTDIAEVLGLGLDLGIALMTGSCSMALTVLTLDLAM